MAPNVLITGGSGYLGGSLLAHLSSLEEPLLPAANVYATVRSEAQAEGVRGYGFRPLTVDFADPADIRRAVVDNDISVVFFLTDPVGGEAQTEFIGALAEVKGRLGGEVHFLHTSGAKMFSSHAAAPTDGPLLDTRPDLYEVHKAQRPGHPLFQKAVATNCGVIEEAEKAGVRSYVFVPCIVYGKGEGFGNKISIQTVAVVKAARAVGRVFKVDEGRPTWPVCHIADNTGLYAALLRAIVAGENPGHGKQGFYLASPGSVAWDDIYAAMARGLAQRGVVADAAVSDELPDADTLAKMGEALGVPPDMVAVQIGGLCRFAAENGKRIGWVPEFAPEHILEYADEEVATILEHLPKA